MSKKLKSVILEAVPTQARAHELMSTMFAAAEPAAIFSEPMVHGEYAVITASETIGGLGYGYGGGGGVDEPGDEAGVGSYGSGGGGGGIGSILGRPVAAISIGPEGVRVEPIVDPTKIAIAFLTMIVAIVSSVRQARKMKRKAMRDVG